MMAAAITVHGQAFLWKARFGKSEEVGSRPPLPAPAMNPGKLT
jgi:hypothetical protein